MHNLFTLILLLSTTISALPRHEPEEELGFVLLDIVPTNATNGTAEEKLRRRGTDHPRFVFASKTSRIVQPRTSNTPAKTSITQAAAAAASTSSVPAIIIPTPTSTPIPVATGLQIVQSWSGANFLNGFSFFNYPDPTNGAVNFVSASQARALGLAYTTKSGSTILKVDNTTYLANGVHRNSVRITSNTQVNVGSLVIMDAVKLPYGGSVWPAFWTVGNSWPSNGEIDIIEGVNDYTQNQMTLHSKPGCTLSTPMAASGQLLGTTCDTSVNYNTGCGVRDPSTQSYGAGFNAAGGGVYAMYYATTGIKIWMFPRGSIPADIQSGMPNFVNWGPPKAAWSGDTCPMSEYFGPQTIVFDITLCGDWAGWQYSPGGMPGCLAAVQNPRTYDNAFFEVNYVNVYALPVV